MINNKENKIEGKNAIFEAFNVGRGIKKLFVLNGIKDDKVNNLINDVKRTGTIVKFMDREELDKMAETKSHQGIIVASVITLCKLSWQKFSYSSYTVRVF